MEEGWILQLSRVPRSPPLTESIVTARLKGVEGDARGLRQVLGDLGAGLLDAPGLQDGGAHVIQGQHRECLLGTGTAVDSKLFENDL